MPEQVGHVPLMGGKEVKSATIARLSFAQAGPDI